MERTSNLGLIVRNYTCYNTDDIMAVVNKVEELLGRTQRVVVRSDRPDVTIVQTSQPFIPGKSKFDYRHFFSRMGHPRSAKAGVITVPSPKYMFANALEQLAFESADVKLAPAHAASDLAATLTVGVYLFEAADRGYYTPLHTEQARMSVLNGLRLRVNAKPEHVAPKGPNREAERRGRQTKNRVGHDLDRAQALLHAAFMKLHDTNMRAFQNELKDAHTKLCHLRTLLDESRITVNTTPTKGTKA